MDPCYFSNDFGELEIWISWSNQTVDRSKDLQVLSKALKFMRRMGEVEPLKSFIGK